MSTTLASANPGAKSPSKNAGAPPSGIERRRRKRARITAQVHIRLASHSAEPFQEVGKSVDVSRDGLLFITTRSSYWKGQKLAITFPYSSVEATINQAQEAEVVRVADAGEGQFHVAVQFTASKAEAKSERKTIGGQTGAMPGTRVNDDSPAASDAQKNAPSLVLLVEPDQRTADVVRTLLQQDGYVVTVVPDAQAALDVLRTTIPAVFLAEVEGGEISGHDLCVIIKRNERLKHVPVILLTCGAQPSDYAASHQLGAVVCMAKPFKPERLRNVVRLVAPPSKAGASAYGTSGVASGNIERSL